MPARQLDSGEELTIRLGYTDKDASAKRTVVDTPAKAPDRFAPLTRTFRLSEEDIADIREARADGSMFRVTFKAFVSKQRNSLSIRWGTAPAVTDRTAVTRDYSRAADVPRTVTVTVTGGEIGGGDFTITDIAQSISIVDGARNRDQIEVSGTSKGFEMGAILSPWIRFPGQTEFTQGTAQILVDDDGEWSWGRKTSKETWVQIRSQDGDVRSNTVRIQAR